MPNNLGKAFEKKFLEDWKRSFPDSFIFRIKDDVSHYKYAAINPCDFIGYVHPQLFLLELKTTQGNTFPFSRLTQYQSLLGYSNIKGVVSGVIIWYNQRDKVVFVPISECTKMIEEGLKSINIKHLDKYSIIEIPSRKKRVFMDSDYTVLAHSEEV